MMIMITMPSIISRRCAESMVVVLMKLQGDLVAPCRKVWHRRSVKLRCHSVVSHNDRDHQVVVR